VEKSIIIMGLGIDFPRNGLEQLQSILGLGSNNPLWDVALVSFDLEQNRPRKTSPRDNMYNEIKEIGVSMLDTRSFSSHAPSGSLSTQHLVVGGHKRLVHTVRDFHFGTSEHID
jgi:hypothetical protein